MSEHTAAYINGVAVGLVIGAVAGIIGGRLTVPGQSPASAPIVTRVVNPEPTAPDTVTRFIPVRAPVFRERDIAASVAETPDSATVSLPVTRREYADSGYRAVVEGYQPRLVSLDIYRPPLPEPKRKRWHIGPSIGIGYDGHGVRPYVGVTLTFSLWEL